MYSSCYTLTFLRSLTPLRQRLTPYPSSRQCSTISDILQTKTHQQGATTDIILITIESPFDAVVHDLFCFLRDVQFDTYVFNMSFMTWV